MNHGRFLHSLYGAVAATLLYTLGSAAFAQALPEITFTDVALESGFQDRLAHGRAMVAYDFNQDGWVDFYLGNPGDEDFPDDNFILWNDGPDGEGNFSFTKGQVLLKGELAFTASAADYDNDGDADLFIGIGGQEGIGLDYLFRNDDGTFTDVSEEAGIRGQKAPDGRWVPAATSSGTWADYDRDGFLDLYAAYRIKGTSLTLPGELGWKDALFRNNGDGTFSNVTDFAGIDGTESSMTSSWGDFDNDGWMDIFIPHFKDEPWSKNGYQLYRNNQDGTFSEVPLNEHELEVGNVAYWASCANDFNNDGHLDIIGFGRFQGHSPDDSHALLVNQGNAVFTNEAISARIAGPGVRNPRTMGCQIGDLTNNGYPDIVIANGGPAAGEIDDLLLNVYTPETGLLFEDHSFLINYPAPPDPNCVPPQRSQAMSQSTLVDHDSMLPARSNDPEAIDTGNLPNTGEDPFCEPSWPYRGHGVALADYDKDGDLDIAMIKGGTAIIAPSIPSVEPNRLFRNDGANVNNWFFLELRGSASNLDGVGARIQLTSSRGGEDSRTVYRDAQAGSCFSASGPREIHFGLGDHDTVDSIRIRWPSGVETVLGAQAINQRIVVDEEILSHSDFNDGSQGAWVDVRGEWDIQHDNFVQRGTGPSFAVDPTSAGSDYTAVAKLTYVGGEKKMSLLARASEDGRDFYGAVLDGNTAKIVKSVDNVLTSLSEPVAIDPMSRGMAYIVSLRISGQTIEMSVDGAAPVVVGDASLSSGLVAISTSDTAAGFDNIIVY